MDRLFWTFCTFLVILTLISSFGGSIRYRENFFEELFDNDMSNGSNHGEDVASISSKILSQTLVSQEMEENIIPSPVASIPTVQSTPSSKPSTSSSSSSSSSSAPSPSSSSSSPTSNQSVQPSRTNFFKNQSNSYGPVIEAFDGGLYASAR